MLTEFSGDVIIGKERPQGHHKAGCVVCPEPEVSRRHCIIALKMTGGKRYIAAVADVSTNGTFIDGQRIKKHM